MALRRWDKNLWGICILRDAGRWREGGGAYLLRDKIALLNFGERKVGKKE